MITTDDYMFFKNFIRDSKANENKQQLMSEIKVLLEYLSWIQNNSKMLGHLQIPLTVKQIIDDPAGKICNFDTFLLSFNNIYLTNPEFRDSLLIGLCKGIVSKLNGKMNLRWTSKILDFSNVIWL